MKPMKVDPVPSSVVDVYLQPPKPIYRIAVPMGAELLLVCDDAEEAELCVSRAGATITVRARKRSKKAP